MSKEKNLLTDENFRSSIQKGFAEEFYLSHITRKYSYWITLLFIRFKIHSNTVTAVSFVFAVIGAVLQSSLTTVSLSISILMMLLYNILDHVDGEVARFEIKVNQEQKGLDGPYYDALVHYFFTPLLFFALGLADYKTHGYELSLWCGLIIGMWLSSYSQSAAYRVILDFIVRNDNNSKTLKKIEPVWKHDKTEKGSITIKEHFYYFLRECFSTQGVIYTLTALHLISLFFPHSFQLRFYYLYLMGGVALLNTPRICYKYFNQLKKIK